MSRATTSPIAFLLVGGGDLPASPRRHAWPPWPWRAGLSGRGDGNSAAVLLLRPPGVYPSQRDTWLLAEALEREPTIEGARVLDLGTGSGALALAAARAGATQVTAVDVSRQALATAWVNARCRGLRVRVRLGDLVQPVLEERFDVIVSNPPYVPSEYDRLPQRGLDRCYDGGIDGRAVLDRVCTEGPKLLAPGGVFLVVHSAVCGVSATLAHLAGEGLDASVAARCDHEFGPVLSARADLLASRGMIEPGQRTEELVVVRAQRRG